MNLPKADADLATWARKRSTSYENELSLILGCAPRSRKALFATEEVSPDGRVRKW